jgi:hypothetical protein
MKFEVREVIARCATIDWRRPRHDQQRVEAAYRRRLAATGLTRRVRWIADPADAATGEFGTARMAKGAKIWCATTAKAAIDFWTTEVSLDTSAAGRDPWRVRLVRDPLWDPWDAWGDSAMAANPWGEVAIARNAWEAEAGGAAARIAMDRAAAWDGCVAGTTAWAKSAALMAHPMLDPLVNPANPVLSWASWVLLNLNPVVVSPQPQPPMAVRTARAVVAACTAQGIWAQCAAAAAWDSTTAWDAGLAVGCLNLTVQNERIDRLVAAYEPMIEAYEAGAFAHSLLNREVLVLAGPSIFTEGGQLHRADGPALAWPRTKVYAWRGTVVPERLIMRPCDITPQTIRAESDDGLRRAMAEISAHARERNNWR